MTAWLIETLVWTAVLIAAVLTLRRPVARWFGPQFAYALWAIPMLRLLLPPIELPSWLRPVDVQPAANNDTQFAILDPVTPVATMDGPAGFEAAAPTASVPVTPALSFDIEPYIETVIEIGIAIWLIGAAIFLVMRFSAYFRLRDQLLAKANEVGRNGKVRLIETADTNAPLAFGVIDKVIALPQGFLAQPDRTARDLALAHEMAHHEGQDLLINVLVQPLFALHWFNPLGRYGWLALRRDQEAACDARVIAAKPAEERQAYANLIVSFAAGPNLALAAPMACPVLGEKSIIQRLRSLQMTDTSKRRRFAGRLMLGAGVIALPLTASISYAASEAPLAPVAPIAPAAPGVGGLAPVPPVPPVPPLPSAAASLASVDGISTVDSDTVDPETGETRDGTREERIIIIRDEDGETTERRVERIRRSGDRETMSDERIEEIMVEVRRGLEEAHLELQEVNTEIEQALAEAREAQGRTVIEMKCDNSSDEVASTTENADGSRTVMLCQTRVMAHALEGLRQARAEIASSREMSADMRRRILRELDQQIDRWEDGQS